MSEHLITERLSPNIKTALYSNFSNAHEAILEIIDNAVSHRIEDKKLVIRIDFVTRPKKIVIEDIGGEGMGIDDLKFFMHWGGTKERAARDIGQYGQGGKAAFGYLGNSFELITSPAGKTKAYRIYNLDLTDTSVLKTYRVNESEASSQMGYTRIEIGKLKVSLTGNLKEKLIGRILDTYRPLIEQCAIEIEVDRNAVRPAPFPLDRDFKVENFEFFVKNKVINGWIGRLTTRSGLKGGMRCYYKGRLICEKEFFGHPDPTYKGTLNYLFGEVYLDFVPVNTNKTDFLRDSSEWLVVEKEMYTILQPHIAELLGRKIEEPTDDEIERVKKTSELYQQIQKMIGQESKFDGISGDEHGQKPPERRENQTVFPIVSQLSGTKYNPRTPPPEDKLGIRKRIRQLPVWQVRPMEATIRSKIEETPKGKVLIINNMFSAYKKTGGNEFYLLETAALQAVPIEDTSVTPQRYLEEFDSYFSKMCEHIDVAKEVLKKKKGMV